MAKGNKAVAAIAVVIAAFGCYFVLGGSPSKDINAAIAAFENHDLETFEKYVDLDGVVGIFDDVFAYELERDGKSAETPSARELAAELKPSFVMEMKKVAEGAVLGTKYEAKRGSI